MCLKVRIDVTAADAVRLMMMLSSLPMMHVYALTQAMIDWRAALSQAVAHDV